MKETSKLYKKAGSTLPGVIIAIGVIGIIAALALPGIIQKCQKLVLQNQLKTAYSTLAQGIQKAMAEDNGTYFKGTNLAKQCSKKDNEAACFEELDKYFILQNSKSDPRKSEYFDKFDIGKDEEYVAGEYRVEYKQEYDYQEAVSKLVYETEYRWHYEYRKSCGAWRPSHVYGYAPTCAFYVTTPEYVYGITQVPRTRYEYVTKKGTRWASRMEKIIGHKWNWFDKPQEKKKSEKYTTQLTDDGINFTLYNGTAVYGFNGSSMYVDVNGEKRPNTIGLDIYSLNISDNGELKGDYYVEYLKKNSWKIDY